MFIRALQLQNPSALGAGLFTTPSGSFFGSAVVLDGAAVQLQSSAGSPLTVASLLTLSGTGIDLTGTGTGALVSTGGSNTWTGPIVLTPLPGFAPPTFPSGQVAVGASTGATLTITSANPTTTAAITETVPTGLLKVDPGTVILASTNAYSGGTEVQEGALDIQNPTSLGIRPTANAGNPLGTVQRITTISNTR